MRDILILLALIVGCVIYAVIAHLLFGFPT
jgi:hypothetical protein